MPRSVQVTEPAPAAGGSSPPSAHLVLAFDFGRRRIGAACGDTLSRTARPLNGLPNSAAGPPWQLIDALLKDWRPNLLVVGLPYNVDGSESAMNGTVRRFADELTTRSGLPVRLVDERYSSREAESRLKTQRNSGVRRRRVARADIDAAAACIILERWLTEST